MAQTRQLPGVGTLTEETTNTRMVPGVGMVTETIAAAAGTNRLLMINPPSLDGGFANGGLSL